MQIQKSKCKRGGEYLHIPRLIASWRPVNAGNEQASAEKKFNPPCGGAHTAQCSVHKTFYIHSYSDLEGFQTVVFASPMPPLQLAAAMSIEKALQVLG